MGEGDCLEIRRVAERPQLAGYQVGEGHGGTSSERHSQWIPAVVGNHPVSLWWLFRVMNSPGYLLL